MTNGITFIGFFGSASNHQHARLESELRGALDALLWVKHLAADTPCEVRFSSHAFSVFMGEDDCPHELMQLLDQTRRAYITSSERIRIDRERHALVSKDERLAA